MTDPRLVELLRALPPGGTVWLAAAGKSLWPLVRSGDVLWVRRCDAGELELGDLAVVEAPGGLIAHIVSSVAPVRTVSIVGVEDPPGLTALGRVEGWRRGERRVAWPRGAGRYLRWVPVAAGALKRVRPLRWLVHRVRD